MKKYDEKYKKEAVKKYLDGQPVASISREIEVNENTIHKCKKDLLSVSGEVDQEKLSMRKRIFELEQKDETLKKGGLLCRKRTARYEFIFESVEDASSEIFSYIKVYDDRIGRHWSLN